MQNQEKPTKPVVQIKNCFMLEGPTNSHLVGVVLDYPESHMGYAGCVTNGRDVTTSPVVHVSADRGTVETQRTVYKVQNWLD